MKKFFLSGILVFFLDRISKWIVVKKLSFGTVIKVFPFFNLVRNENRGIAFGLFQGISGKFFFNILVLVVLVIIAVEGIKVAKRESCGLESISFGLILGGGMSNLIDRFFYGKVVDFLDLHLGAYHWPAFNIADAGVTIGFILLIIGCLRGKRCF